MVELPYFTSRWYHDEQIKKSMQPASLHTSSLLEDWKNSKALQTIIPIFRRYEKARLLVGWDWRL